VEAFNQFDQQFTSGFCADILFPKITNTNFYYRKAAKTHLYGKAAHKMLMKWTPS